MGREYEEAGRMGNGCGKVVAVVGCIKVVFFLFEHVCGFLWFLLIVRFFFSCPCPCLLVSSYRFLSCFFLLLGLLFLTNHDRYMSNVAHSSSYSPRLLIISSFISSVVVVAGFGFL